MEQRLSLITLGVGNLARAVAFYEKLGWLRGMRAAEGVAFFQLGGIVLSLYSREDLAEDAGLAPFGEGFSGVALAHNTRTKDEVDTAMGLFLQAGGTLVRRAQDKVWGGYAGYVADPDGHLWEIAYNPGFPIAEDGSVRLPE